MQANTYTANQPVVENLDHERIQKFVYHESRLLDERRFEEWIELFDDDATYWVPAQIDQQSPLNQLSIFYDDKELMQTRIARLRHERIHVDDPQTRSVRMLSNLEIESAEPGAGYDLRARAVLCAIVFFQQKQYIYGGRCEYQLRDRNNALSIYCKRVNLINCDSAFHPLVVPF